MDRPRTTIARSETAQWFSPGVLEHTGRRWREDARARLNVIGGPSESPLEVPRCCAQRAEPQPSRVSRSQGPLEISGEIGNYILADFPMSLRELELELEVPAHSFYRLARSSLLRAARKKSSKPATLV